MVQFSEHTVLLSLTASLSFLSKTKYGTMVCELTLVCILCSIFQFILEINFYEAGLFNSVLILGSLIK